MSGITAYTGDTDNTVGGSKTRNYSPAFAFASRSSSATEPTLNRSAGTSCAHDALPCGTDPSREQSDCSSRDAISIPFR